MFVLGVVSGFISGFISSFGSLSAFSKSSIDLFS